MSQLTKDLLVAIGLPFGLYIINIILQALLLDNVSSGIGGAVIGWILLVLFMPRTYRDPYTRLITRLTSHFTIDIDIDTARKSDSKDQLKRNPLDDD